MFCFIIVCRDRDYERELFLNHMNSMMCVCYPGMLYNFVCVCQCDDFVLNRGSMRNVGFMYMRSMYPLEYKNCTYIFHDIDNVICDVSCIDFKSESGVVKHLYGYKRALGGIVVFNGVDFENVGGYPNIWGWGYEDNLLRLKWLKMGGKIDYSHFMKRGDPRVIEFNHYVERSFNVEATVENIKKYEMDGIKNIKDLVYEVDDSERESRNLIMLNVTNFSTLVPPPSSITTANPPLNFYKDLQRRSLNVRHKSMNGLMSKVMRG